jgi:inner membrane protein
MTHCFAGVFGAGAARMRRLWFLSLVCSALPDIDGVISRLASRLFGLQLTGMWWAHRGFSHSVLFALIIGVLAGIVARKIMRFEKPTWLLALYFFAVVMSHGLIDGTTYGGEGVMFFAPFETDRYLFLFTPVPTLNARQWLGSQGLMTFAKEMLWIWLPLSIVGIGLRLFRKTELADPGSKEDQAPIP